jgi:glycosyltransferase involved in cell wall biosynthesis
MAAKVVSTPSPLLSVVMPVYNAEKYLAAAIESILQQSFREFELIVVDDASTDSSPDLIRHYAELDQRLVCLPQARNGMISRALNAGIARARGKYIVRMDADDLAMPDRLRKQVTFMEAHPEIGVSGGSMLIMDENARIFSRRTYHLHDADIRRHLFRYSPFSHPTIILRKAVLEQCGLYNPDFDLAEDYELYFRIGRVAQFGNLPDVLLHYRVVNKSITGQVTRKMERITLAIRRKAVREYGYQMSWLDWGYWILQYLSLCFFPANLKKSLFIWLRGRKS